jgi:hypothetical protein
MSDAYLVSVPAIAVQCSSKPTPLHVVIIVDCKSRYMGIFIHFTTIWQQARTSIWTREFDLVWSWSHTGTQIFVAKGDPNL